MLAHLKIGAGRALLLALLLSAAGCQLLVDLDGLEDQHCGPDKKACPGVGCVNKRDPATGCNDPRCVPCAPRHAIAICSQADHCSFAPNSCIGDWADCDGIEDTGCETDLAHTPNHCGDCLNVCQKPMHGIAGCSNRKCVIGGCTPGWEDCDHLVENGCERQVWTDTDCLTCDMPCATGTHCDQGVCL
jgi:hypothetical protein